MWHFDLSYIQLNCVIGEEIVYQPKESKIRLILPSILLIICLFYWYKWDKDPSYDYFSSFQFKQVETDGSGAVVNGVKHKNVSKKTNIEASWTWGELSFLDKFKTEEDFLKFVESYIPLFLYILGFLCLLPVIGYVNQEMAFTTKRIVIKKWILSIFSDEIMLTQVEWIKLKKWFFWRIFWYWDVIISWNGWKKIIFRDVLKPEYLKNSVFWEAVATWKENKKEEKKNNNLVIKEKFDSKDLNDAFSEFLKID